MLQTSITKTARLNTPAGLGAMMIYEWGNFSNFQAKDAKKKLGFFNREIHQIHERKH
jgi:hypothetical protein